MTLNLSPVGQAIDAYEGPVYWKTPEGRIGLHPAMVEAVTEALDRMYEER